MVCLLIGKNVKLAFALYKYFPFGGLQRDMLAIARECAHRGHTVQVFCQGWSGECPEDKNIQINILPDKKHHWQSSANHSKNARFVRQLQQTLRCIDVDLVIGFNRIPGVDIYYAADTCFKAKLLQERPWIYRLLPRYRHFASEEAALFAPGSHTHILTIAARAREEYRQHYQTPQQRFSLLPPGIARDRVNNNGEQLDLLRSELGLDSHSHILLMVGSGFRTKGLDRAIDALATLPGDLRQHSHLVVAGEDHREPFVQQAKNLGVETNLHFLGGRKDIPQLLKSADLLLHPAYRENTGTVLLEAAVSGLPVIASGVCGYAAYIAEQDLGVVLAEPFEKNALRDVLADALTNEAKREKWRNNGLVFAQQADIYDMPKRAAEIIEQIAAQKGVCA